MGVPCLHKTRAIIIDQTGSRRKRQRSRRAISRKKCSSYLFNWVWRRGIRQKRNASLFILFFYYFYFFVFLPCKRPVLFTFRAFNAGTRNQSAPASMCRSSVTLFIEEYHKVSWRIAMFNGRFYLSVSRMNARWGGIKKKRESSFKTRYQWASIMMRDSLRQSFFQMILNVSVNAPTPLRLCKAISSRSVLLETNTLSVPGAAYLITFSKENKRNTIKRHTWTVQ